MFKWVCAIALAFSSIACVASPVYPIDSISRAKFPTVNGRLIDELAFINKIVNASITYTDDESHYGKGNEDLWVMNPSDSKGDCEDYALTKLYLMERLADASSRDPLNKIDSLGYIHLVYVDAHFNDLDGKGWQVDGHEILAVRLPDHSVAYLDLNNEELMTRKELIHAQDYGGVKMYYKFYDWVG